MKLTFLALHQLLLVHVRRGTRKPRAKPIRESCALLGGVATPRLQQQSLRLHRFGKFDNRGRQLCNSEVGAEVGAFDD